MFPNSEKTECILLLQNNVPIVCSLDYQSLIATDASCRLSISGVNDRHAKMKYFVTHTEQINEDLARQEAEPPRGAVNVNIV